MAVVPVSQLPLIPQAQHEELSRLPFEAAQQSMEQFSTFVVSHATGIFEATAVSAAQHPQRDEFLHWFGRHLWVIVERIIHDRPGNTPQLQSAIAEGLMHSFNRTMNVTRDAFLHALEQQRSALLASAEHHELRSSSLTYELGRLREALRTATQQHQQLQGDYHRRGDELADARSQISDLSHRVHAFESKIAGMTAEHSTTLDELRRLKSEAARSSELSVHTAALESELQQLKHRLQQAEDAGSRTIADATRRERELIDAGRQVEDQRNALQARLQEATLRADRAEHDLQSEREAHSTHGHQTELALQEAVSRERSTSEGLRHNLQRTNLATQELRHQLETEQLQHQASDRANHQLSDDIAALHVQNAELHRQVQRLQQHTPVSQHQPAPEPAVHHRQAVSERSVITAYPHAEAAAPSVLHPHFGSHTVYQPPEARAHIDRFSEVGDAPVTGTRRMQHSDDGDFGDDMRSHGGAAARKVATFKLTGKAHGETWEEFFDACENMLETADVPPRHWALKVLEVMPTDTRRWIAQQRVHLSDWSTFRQRYAAERAPEAHDDIERHRQDFGDIRAHATDKIVDFNLRFEDAALRARLGEAATKSQYLKALRNHPVNDKLLDEIRIWQKSNPPVSFDWLKDAALRIDGDLIARRPNRAAVSSTFDGRDSSRDQVQGQQQRSSPPQQQQQHRGHHRSQGRRDQQPFHRQQQQQQQRPPSQSQSQPQQPSSSAGPAQQPYKSIICYNCQKPGHTSRDCKGPKQHSSAGRPPLKVGVVQGGRAASTRDFLSLRFLGRPVSVLVDTGAQLNFVPSTIDFGIAPQDCKPFVVQTADGKSVTINKSYTGTLTTPAGAALGQYTRFYVLPGAPAPILGMGFLRFARAVIDVGKHGVTLLGHHLLLQHQDAPPTTPSAPQVSAGAPAPSGAAIAHRATIPPGASPTSASSKRRGKSASGKATA
jgi:hypothetical protein